MWRDQLPWVEKYRPHGLEEVLGHEDVINTIRSFLRKGELPHILLHGPPGTGKTSLVQAIAKSLYGKNLKRMVLELNASDDRGISTVRTLVKTFAESRAPVFSTPRASASPPAAKSADTVKMEDGENAPATNGKSAQPTLMNFFGAKPSAKKESIPKSTIDSMSDHPVPPGPEGFIGAEEIQPSLRTLKLVVLDEVDQMTAAAQTALRRIMEKHAANVRFFLMCNDVGKINPPIQSRCTKFRFMPLPDDFIGEKLQLVVKSEGLKITPEAIQLLIRRAKGDFRRLLNILQAASLTYPASEITESGLLKILGLPEENEMETLMTRLCSGQGFCNLVGELHNLVDTKGYSLHDILMSMYERLIVLDLPNEVALAIFPKLAELDENLSVGCTDSTQIPALVAIFIEAREIVHRLKKEVKPFK